ncbi:MAG: ASKHA domain-containing protein [Faecousia sp.]
MATVTVSGQSISVEPGMTLSQVLGHSLEMPCAGHGRCGKCKVTVSGALSPLSATEQAHLTAEEIARGVRLACCTRVEGDCRVSLPGSAHSQICLSGVMGNIALRPRFRSFGAAVDIGTTTLAASLYGADGTLLAQASMANPQAAWGADVISRIEAALKGEGPALAASVRGAIDDLLGQMAAQARIDPEKIDALVITGNTAMLHLFTETSPEPLSHAPFEAKRLFGEVCTASSLGLSACPGGEIYLPRCMSAFVGADITTALLASGICETADTRILVDIGTNGEMALWHKGELTCCSTAAGPAFEGAGLSMGMHGQDGAVDHVTLRNGALQPHVIGEGQPVGICGSGVIDALACLLETEELDETGLLETDPAPIASPVVLTQKDVRMVQLAKSAISAGLRTLLRTEGISCKDVAELAVAGGFGSYLNVANAGRIGLIPEELVNKVRVLGNAALSGAAMLLLDRELAQTGTRLALSAHTLVLSANPVFSEYYTDGMFF